MTVGPNEGDMACGEYGFGRMAEPHDILAAIEAALTLPRALSGLRALVTSGPTHEPIYPVRSIAHPSSGKQGHEIGRAHVCTPVTHTHLVCRLLLDKQQHKLNLYSYISFDSL